MKKIFNRSTNWSKVLFSCCLLAGAVSLASCEEDEPGEGAGGVTGGVSQSAASNVITTENGDKVVLTAAGDYGPFIYDEQGRCIAIGDDFTFSYNPFKVVRGDRYDDEVKMTYSAGLNAKGYLNTIANTYVEDYGYEKLSTSLKLNLTYDSNGHLVKVAGTEKGKEEYDGETYSWSGNGNITYTWNDGNLVKAVGTLKGDGYSSKITITVAYGDEVNEHQQITAALGTIFEQEDLTEEGCFVGLMGKGTAKLPVSIKYVEEWTEDGDSGVDEFVLNMRYMVNADGTIASEFIDEIYEDYTDSYYVGYSYSQLGGEENYAAKAKVDGPKAGQKKVLRHRLFDRKRK